MLGTRSQPLAEPTPVAVGKISQSGPEVGDSRAVPAMQLPRALWYHSCTAGI